MPLRQNECFIQSGNWQGFLPASIHILYILNSFRIIPRGAVILYRPYVCPSFEVDSRLILHTLRLVTDAIFLQIDILIVSNG